MNDDFLRITAHVPETITDDLQQPAQAEAQQAPSLITPEMVATALGPTLSFGFDAIGNMRGRPDVWHLKQFEQNALVKGWTPIIQILLLKLGSETQVLLALALTPTVAIVMGKVAAERTKPASSTASTSPEKSEASSPSSASVEAEKPSSPSVSPEAAYD